MARFAVEMLLANHYEVRLADDGRLPAEQVHRTTVIGVVDTGATRLVLPAFVVEQLHVRPIGRTVVKFADGRRDERKVVGDVEVEIQGRTGVFSAVVEPGRTDALIGTIVLEELDFVPDCALKRLVPRDPHTTITEIE